MINKRLKLSKVILGICFIGLLGFKDTGIFVKDTMAVDRNGIQAEFNKYEEINLISEREGNYLIEKQGKQYDIPSDSLIRTSKISQKYKLKKDTMILDKPFGKGFKSYEKNHVFQLLKHDGDYGLFECADGIQGYLNFLDLDAIVEDYYTYGTSKVNKTLKNKNMVYKLVKGQEVAIKDFRDNSYIILDENKNEFRVPNKDIELSRKIKKTISREQQSTKSLEIDKLIQSAHDKIGSKYVYADIGKKGYDCSGLTYSLYLNELGIKLNRTSIDQANNGIYVDREDLIPGDLVFFKTTSYPIGHVGLYIGDGNMIHASSSKNQVIISSINKSGYYTSRYVTGRRIIN